MNQPHISCSNSSHEIENVLFYKIHIYRLPQSTYFMLTHFFQFFILRLFILFIVLPHSLSTLILLLIIQFSQKLHNFPLIFLLLLFLLRLYFCIYIYFSHPKSIFFSHSLYHFYKTVFFFISNSLYFIFILFVRFKGKKINFECPNV